MVTARYLTNKFVKPVIEKHRGDGGPPQDEGRQRYGRVWVTARYLGRRPGRRAGTKAGEGRDEERRMWTDWNTRRLEAEKNGEPFDEPPPAS